MLVALGYSPAEALARIGTVALDDNVISNICLGNLDSEGNPGSGFSGGLGFNDQGELVPIPTTNGGPSGTIPEPCTFVLIGSGLVSLLASRKGLWGGRCRSKA